MYFCACFVILLFTLIGLTTPILGAAVRYKIPAIPFLVIAFLFILDKQKLINCMKPGAGSELDHRSS